MERGGEKRKVGPRVVGAELHAHCHATEDCQKVLASILNLLPPDLRGLAIVRESVAFGYYGNPIKSISVELGEGSELVAKYLGERVSETDRSVLSASLDLRFDKRSGRLYLRVDKQSSYLGSVELRDSDDVVKVVFRLKGCRSTEELREYLRGLGLAK